MANIAFLGKDPNGAVNYGLPLSNNIASATIAANTATSVTVPAGCTSVFFSYSNGTDVWVEFKNGTPAAIPSSGFSFGTRELNPVARYGLTPSNTISFISPTNSYIEAYFSA